MHQLSQTNAASSTLSHPCMSTASGQALLRQVQAVSFYHTASSALPPLLQLEANAGDDDAVTNYCQHASPFAALISGSASMAKLTCAPYTQGPSDIFNYDELQTKDLFLGMVKRGEENCLSDNRWSAVQCQGAKRNPGLPQASKSAMPVASTEEKPASAVAVAIKDAAEGGLMTILFPTCTPQHTLCHQPLPSGA